MRTQDTLVIAGLPYPIAMLASLSLLAAVGCDVGSVASGRALPDAGLGLVSDAAPTDPLEVACDPLVADVGDGEHNAGDACLNSACHGLGGEGPRFTLGGTIFATLGGGAAVAGATVHLIDGQGTEVTLTTAPNGNFWSTASLTFPLTTYASLCPDVEPMVGPISAGNADCNSGGCHDADNRIHLP